MKALLKKSAIKQKASPGLSCERLGLTLFYHITLRTGFELSHPESNQ
mgnify:CR=1 FL=1